MVVLPGRDMCNGYVICRRFPSLRAVPDTLGPISQLSGLLWGHDWKSAYQKTHTNWQLRGFIDPNFPPGYIAPGLERHVAGESAFREESAGRTINLAFAILRENVCRASKVLERSGQ